MRLRLEINLCNTNNTIASVVDLSSNLNAFTVSWKVFFMKHKPIVMLLELFRFGLRHEIYTSHDTFKDIDTLNIFKFKSCDRENVERHEFFHLIWFWLLTFHNFLSLLFENQVETIIRNCNDLAKFLYDISKGNSVQQNTILWIDVIFTLSFIQTNDRGKQLYLLVFIFLCISKDIEFLSSVCHSIELTGEKCLLLISSFLSIQNLRLVGIHQMRKCWLISFPLI